MKRSRTEELKLLFALEAGKESDELAIGSGGAQVQPRRGFLDPVTALQKIVETMLTLGIDATFTENRRLLSADNLVKNVEKKGGWGRIETGQLVFQYGVVSSYEHCFITVQEREPHAARVWDEWLTPFVDRSDFVQGWLSDVEYDYWQNAKDPLEYEVAGRDFSRLPMKSNGLPPPLQRLEIDTSNNPGRWTLKPGYVEAVGSVMWLSDLFWDRVGHARRSEALAANWARTRQLACGSIEIRVLEACFNSEETADVQNRLRELLYR